MTMCFVFTVMFTRIKLIVIRERFRVRTGSETETKGNWEMVNSGLSEFRFIFYCTAVFVA